MDRAEELKVTVAGATGYLGRHLVAELLRQGHQVTALARPGANTAGFDAAVKLRFVEATEPETLQGVFERQDLVLSCLGLTRQKDALRYMDVDYRDNLNLLQAAMAQGVGRFGYVHALVRGAPQSDLIRAKARFVKELKNAPIDALVFRPTGFFVDLEAVFDMAKSGRVWSIGKGDIRLNPIAGEDLARVIVKALPERRGDLEIGGPEVLSLNEIAELAFQALGRPVRIHHLPRSPMVALLRLLKPVTPRHIWGPFEFFLAVSAQDAIGPSHGTRRLGSHFRDLAVALSPGWASGKAAK